MNKIIHLFKREVQAELRQMHMISGVILYVLSTIFVCYLGFERLDSVQTWNGLLWIIILFAAFNAIGRSFDRERTGYVFYLYTLVSAQTIIVSKILFNLMMMIFLSLLSIAFYLLFLGDDALGDVDFGQFLTGLILGATALAMSLTLISGIAAKAGGNLGMMALLAFPVVIPALLVLMRFSANAINGLPWAENFQNLIILVVINGGVLALSYVLFPYLWRD